MTIYLDAGHGGIDLQGIYTTAPSKMYTHTHGTFHRNSTFYEGVSNRTFADLLAINLTQLGINVVKVYHEYIDYSLQSRCELANKKYKQNPKEPSLYLSLHSDASDGNANGISIFTSVGTTKSDEYATTIYNQFNKDLSNIVKLRSELSDKDPDYEKNFYVLVNTNMPAILIENLFFDNYKNATILMDPNYQKLFVDSLSKALLLIDAKSKLTT